MKKNKILVTGSSGFIGFHVCYKLLKHRYKILGLDNHNNYYDPKLKQKRLNLLNKHHPMKIKYDCNSVDFLRKMEMLKMIRKKFISLYEIH